MPIYYPPPQPAQATPRVPIGNQGDQPPLRTLHSLYAQRGMWSEPSWPAQYGPRIAPQTLVYGDQPPPRTNAPLYQVRATWMEPTWAAQSEPSSASWNVPVANQPPTGLVSQIYQLRAQWPETTWPAQYPARIAPLTLTYGDQPPRFEPLQPVWPQLTWNAQSAPPNASWNVPALVAPFVPPNPPQWHVWQSWQTPPQPTQRATTLVQPSTGDQPPPTSIYIQMAVRNQWPDFNWPAQSAAPNAAWNFAPAQVDNPPSLPQVPWQIWASWNIPPQPQQLPQLQVVDNPPTPPPVSIDGGHPARETDRQFEQRLFRELDHQDFANPEYKITRLPVVEKRDPRSLTSIATPAPKLQRYDDEIMAILWMLM